MFNSILKAQELPLLNSSKLEDLAEKSGEENDYSEIEDLLESFKGKRINLNHDAEEKLFASGLFSEIQILNLKNHIQHHGFLLAPEELQVIDGFDAEFIRMIIPFISVTGELLDKRLHPKEVLQNGKSAFTWKMQRTLEKQKGYSGLKYSGDEWKLNFKYRYTAGDYLSICMNGEKDAGEKFGWNNNVHGFDFYSGHIAVKPGKKLRQVIIGDFQVQAGQGLVAWTGVSYGKSSDGMSVRKNAIGIRPYSSSAEAGFYRGIAFSAVYKKINTLMWFSSVNADAVISDDDSSGLTAGAIREDGYHRTESEIKHKNSVLQQTAGISANHNFKNGSVGLVTEFTGYDKALKAGIKAYEAFEITSDKFLNYGVNFQYNWRNFNFFSESASDFNFNPAFLAGFLAGIDKRVSISVIYRNYSTGYTCVNCEPFRENTNPSNEKGFYTGMQFQFTRKFMISGYLDLFRFPWLKYQVSSPSSGADWLIRINYIPSRGSEMYFRIQQKISESDGIAENGIRYPQLNTKTGFRFHAEFKLSANLSFQSRTDYLLFKNGSGLSSGSAQMNDVSWKPMGKPFTLSVRYGLFETGSYDSRIYSYEQDMPGSFSVPAYSGKGQRVYLLLRYRFFRGLDTWARLGRSTYRDTASIGSGNDEITGNRRTDLKIQIRYTF